jgi:hypothetical protein
MLLAKTLEEGGLIWRLPKGPIEPRRLSEQLQQEVRDRLKMGEPKDQIAHAYGVDIAAIKQIAQ